MNSVCVCIGALKALTGSGDSGYIQYVIIEFFEAALVTGAYTSCYVLLVELIGTDKRIIGSAILGVGICLGEMTLAFIAWSVPHWRHFVLVVSCPGAIFLSYKFLLEESMRWLLINGKTDRAIILLEKIGSWNKFTVSVRMKDIKVIGSGNVEIESPKEEFHMKLLYQYPAILVRLLVCSWWWFSVSLAYYGLVFSAVALPGDSYTNYALSGLISLPGEFLPLVFLNRIGRRKLFIGCCFISGICNIALAYAPADYSVIKVLVFLLGKMFTTCCFNTLYVYTSELMPTSARGFLMGSCSMVARVGSVLAPLVLLLGERFGSLPSILFGSSILMTALLAFTTPETVNQQLPDTIAEALALP